MKKISKAMLTLALIVGMSMPASMVYAAQESGQTIESAAEESASETEEASETETASETQLRDEESTESTESTESVQESAEEQSEAADDQKEEAEKPADTETETKTEVTPAPETAAESASATETETEAETETVIATETETERETETAAVTETETETVEETQEDVLLEAENNKPGEIKNLKATATDDTITLTWDAADRATAYIIYSYDKATKKRTRILNTKKLTHTFTGLTPGVQYAYVLIPYSTSVSPTAYGPATEPVYVVPGKPGNLTSVSIKSGNKSVTLSWKAAKGAVGYKIFTYDKKTKKLTHLVSTRKLSYTVTGLENGTEYSYRIRPYNMLDKKAIFGNLSKIVSAVAGKPGVLRNLKVKSGNGKAVLSWSAAENATGYRIFSYDPETKKVKGIKSVSALTYTVTGLTNGESYSFKVRPYNNSGAKLVCGSYSNAVTTIPGIPDAITDLKGVGAAGEAILTWSKSEVAQYYQVFQYDFSAKKWHKVSRVTDTTAIISGLTENTTYRFRVLAYNRLNGKLYYKGSNIVNVKPGAAKNGWVTAGGKKYYYKNGTRLKKYQQIGGKYYYFDESTGEMLTGWHEVYGFRLYFDPKTGARWNDVDSLIGKQSSYLIKVNCQANVVNIYAKDSNGDYVIPVKAFICTTGASDTPTVKGTFYTPDKWRWQVLMGPSYGQWVTQIYRGYYFHSVFYYNYNDNNSLAVGPYNNLGKSGSHGCVRLTAGDAKWIYDNCKLGTKVVTYSDSTPGPLGKPTSYKLPSWHTWDPTDPNMKYKCKQRGCH